MGNKLETGDRFVYATYLGGSAMENDSSQSIGPAIAVTPGGEAFVTGSTQSSDFPITADAFQRTRPGGGTDAFITSYNASGVVGYSTYFGAAGGDYPRGIAADNGGAVVVGWTDSADFPIVNGVQPMYGGSEDAFIARVAPETPATIDSIIAAVRAYAASGAIDGGTYRGLMAKLSDAKAAFDRGNLQVARSKLHDFIDQCTGSSRNGLSPAAAEALIADAQRVLQNL